MNLREAMHDALAKALGPGWEALVRLDEAARLYLHFSGGTSARWRVRLQGILAQQIIFSPLGSMLVTRVRDLLEEVRRVTRASLTPAMRKSKSFSALFASWTITQGRGWAKIELKAGDLLAEDGWPESTS